eukprot:174353_1
MNGCTYGAKKNLSCKINANIYCNEILIAADNCIVDGFVFRNAQKSNTDSNRRRRRMKNSVSVEQVLSVINSGGIYSNSTNITVINSIFNMLYTSGKGGAIYCIGQQGEDITNIKSPIFINVAFLGNRAVTRGGAICADVHCNKMLFFDQIIPTINSII